MSILCEIATQDKSLFEGPADIVLAPGINGELGILPKHAPLLTTLGFGVLRVRYQGEEEAFTIAGGVLEVQPDEVIVLADVGEKVDEIDLERAEEAKARAEALLKEGVPEDTDEYLKIQASIQRSTLRLDAYRRFRKKKRARPRPPSEGTG